MRLILIISAIFNVLTAICQQQSFQHPEYQKIKKQLQKGWGTYNTHNVLSKVLLPYGFEIALDFKYQGKNFGGYLNGAQIVKTDEWKEAKVKPHASTYDGSYSKIELEWQDVHVIIETATENEDLMVLITPVGQQKNPASIIVRAGMLWNKPGKVYMNGNSIKAETAETRITVYPVSEVIKDYNIPVSGPYFAFNLVGEVAVCSGKKRTLEEVNDIINTQRNNFDAKATSFGPELAEAWKAINTCLSINTIYEPIYKRVVSTVSRTWNVSRGGYSFFGWDNFFLAYLTALDNKNLSYANVIEHLHDMTDEGFIPNCSQGNGRKSWDRSQPPVGSLMVKEIYKKHPEKWFLEATFNELLTWNRWWPGNRMNGKLLSWGSHPAQNPFNDQSYHNLQAAMLETGLDDSPMYIGLEFDTLKNIMLLHDVGLNALYIADCLALSEIAAVLGKKDVERELTNRARNLNKELKHLWSPEHKIFLNCRTDTGEMSTLLSPTLFYPMISNTASIQQVKEMMEAQFYDTTKFGGEWILPSISRDNEYYPQQRYWKGAIWAPLNFLVYLGMANYEIPGAKAELSERSRLLFVNEWTRKNYVAENYSAITGTSDDPKIKSDPFYSWGALMGIIPFIEEGFMPDPSKSLTAK